MADPKTPAVETPAPEATPATPAAPVEPQVVGAEDLVKTIQKIEADAKGEQPPVEAAPEPKPAEIAPAPLAKTVKDEGSEELTKSLDVSSVLGEFADTVGTHVDKLSGDFAKSINAHQKILMGITGALEGFQKRLGELTEKVEQYGKTPGAPASAAAVTAKPGETLEKSAGAKAAEAGLTREDVLDGCEILVKSAIKAGDDDAANRWSHVATKFETTAQIEDKDLARAVKAHKAQE